jgi:hypothetical protein
MATTRPDKEQATESAQSNDYQPVGRQEAPTNSDALYGGNADDNSGSGGNARPSSSPQDKKSAAIEAKGDAHAADEKEGGISGPGISGGTGSSGTSIGEVTL